MRDYLNKLHDSADPSVRLLYKYRSCQSSSLECLRNDTQWFSTQEQLNDPFDCVIRLPDTVTPSDVREIREFLKDVQPYRLTLKDPREIAEYIGRIPKVPKLMALGLEAAQLDLEPFVSLLRKPEPGDGEWITEVLQWARALHEALLTNTTVFCLSESNDNQLLWAHYANKHTGFCTGYVCPVGILNPQIIYKVRYVKTPPRITPRQLLDDPGNVQRNLILTKPSDWAYEAEWRVTMGNMSGLQDLLPCRAVILGSRMTSADEKQVRKAIGGRDIRICRAVPDQSAGRYEIRIEDA